HEQPRWVPTWSDPSEHGVCTEMAKIVAAADKYGVLPLLRPFVSDWLVHALPPSRIGGQDAIDPEIAERLNLAWQLGAVGRVEDYTRKLVYDSNISAAIVEELLAEARKCPVDRFPALPGLFGVAAKRREAGIQAALDFFGQMINDLNNDDPCRQPIFDPSSIPGYTPVAAAAIEELIGSVSDRDSVYRPLCGITINMYISERIKEVGAENIPPQVKDFPSSVSDLLYTIRCIHGLQPGRVPAPRVLHPACLQVLQKKFEDFAAELLSRWSEPESILELEQVEWLKRRSDILATGSSSA
ncbi:uncharacterized protein B0H64DRAFT_321060, partial [Chaetomium fimeti]